MVIAIAIGAFMLAHPGVQERDTTFSVQEGTSIFVRNERGEVQVMTWSRDRVRIRAEFEGRRGDFTVRVRGTRLEVRGRRGRGGGDIEFEITVPTWMNVSVSGTHTDISIDGSEADVEARTTHGDLEISGGFGLVVLETTNGDIRVERARGQLVVQTINGDIDIIDSEGTMSIETVNGEVNLAGADASRLDVSTMNGDIEYDGSIDADGDYSFSTHNGDVTIVLDPDANARITVSTVYGSFESDCAVRMSRTRSGGRQFDFEIGSGGARIEMESFGGSIILQNRGACRGG